MYLRGKLENLLCREEIFRDSANVWNLETFKMKFIVISRRISEDIRRNGWENYEQWDRSGFIRVNRQWNDLTNVRRLAETKLKTLIGHFLQRKQGDVD